ncbi:DNA cytosine methyltransferase [Staphylococcus xylosus]
MKHGGSRPGSGRNAILGKELKIKLSNDICEQLELNFTGKTVQDRIRECLEFGIKSKVCDMERNQTKQYNVIDIFSGAGGLSRGFMDAGFNVQLGVDFDDAALKTFQENHGSSDILKLDLFNHDNIKKIVDYVKNKKLRLDVLVGGPPCQGFSLAGKREEFDKRNVLYSSMVKIGEQLRPKIIILENVPGMLTLYNGAGAKRVKEDFESIGYELEEPKILYAPEYGVPQIRRRVFFVMKLKGLNLGDFSYPKPELNEQEFVTTEQAISDLPSLEKVTQYSLEQVWEYTKRSNTIYQKFMKKNSDRIYNHIPTKHADETIRLISLVPEGRNYKALPIQELEKRKFKYNEALTRYHSKKPSRTIDTGHRTHFHYKYNRIPTVRENARLQSFPDDFIFYGNKQEQYRQVGNAVPPLLGKAIAKQVKELLDNEKV